MNIPQALAALDPRSEDHWTTQGLPRVEAVVALVGMEVTRKQITDAAPYFLRPEASGMPPEEGEPAPVTPETPAEDPPAETEAEDPKADGPEAAPEGEPAKDHATEDAAQAAFVEVVDDVVTMDVRTVASDVELVERAIAEFGRQAVILISRGEAIATQLKAIGQRSAGWQKVLDKMGKGQGSEQRDALKRYQEQCRKSREKRAERAKAFIEAGTTAQDVKAQLEGPSKIDAAMKQRKPGRGTGRPSYPQTVGAV